MTLCSALALAAALAAAPAAAPGQDGNGVRADAEVRSSVPAGAFHRHASCAAQTRRLRRPDGRTSVSNVLAEIIGDSRVPAVRKPRIPVDRDEFRRDMEERTRKLREEISRRRGRGSDAR